MAMMKSCEATFHHKEHTSSWMMSSSCSRTQTSSARISRSAIIWELLSTTDSTAALFTCQDRKFGIRF